MARQRVSDLLKAQDITLAEGLRRAVDAIRERYPDDSDLKLTRRGLDDFIQRLCGETRIVNAEVSVAEQVG